MNPFWKDINSTWKTHSCEIKHQWHECRTLSGVHTLWLFYYSHVGIFHCTPLQLLCKLVMKTSCKSASIFLSDDLFFNSGIIVYLLQIEGMSRACHGCRDATPPELSEWRTIPNRLFFGHKFTRMWGHGGVAFLDPVPEPDVHTHVRIYKIK